MVPCIRLDKVCAATCTATAENLVVDIDRSQIKGLVEYCIEICRQCADECAQHEHEHCQECAKACKECIKACEQYLA